jgi:hypothetical protein
MANLGWEGQAKVAALITVLLSVQSTEFCRR